jgi:hypothetical protein
LRSASPEVVAGVEHAWRYPFDEWLARLGAVQRHTLDLADEARALMRVL